MKSNNLKLKFLKINKNTVEEDRRLGNLGDDDEDDKRDNCSGGVDERSDRNIDRGYRGPPETTSGCGRAPMRSSSV